MFSSLRIYALWYSLRFKYIVCAAILILGCIPVVTNIVSRPEKTTRVIDTVFQIAWANTTVEYAGFPINDCISIVNISPDLNQL